MDMLQREQNVNELCEPNLQTWNRKTWFCSIREGTLNFLIPLALGYLSRLRDNNLLPRLPTVGSRPTFNCKHNVHALYNLAKDNMFPIQPGCRCIKTHIICMNLLWWYVTQWRIVLHMEFYIFWSWYIKKIISDMKTHFWQPQLPPGFTKQQNPQKQLDLDSNVIDPEDTKLSFGWS